MIKRLLTIVFTLCVVVSYASDIECVGTATQVINGEDTTFIFRNEIHLRSNVGDINWYKSDGTIYASNTDEIYPDDGCYKANGHTFCVQQYKGIDDLNFTVETSCDNTVLHVTGDIGSRAHAHILLII